MTTRTALWAVVVVALGACGPRGPEWLRAEVPVSGELRGVFGTGANDVWVVGEGGAVLHFDGAAFSQLDAKVPARLDGVWAAAPNDVWMVGEQGTVLRFDGHGFTPAAVGVTDELTWVTGLGADDVYVGSSSHTFHWNGSQFLEIKKGSVSFSVDAFGGTAATGLWLVDGSDVYHGSNGSFDPVAVGTTGDWSGIVAGPGGVWLVDGSYTGERLLRFDGTTWSVVALPELPVGWGLKVGWSPAPGQVWFAGDHGNILHLEDGAPVAEASGGYGGPRINGVWGASADDMWVVGKDGWVLRRFVTPSP